MILQRIEPFSVAKLMGVMYFAIGLVFGLLFGVFMMVGGVIGGAAGGPEAVASMVGGVVGGIVFAVLMPVMYGAMGFVAGLFTAWLYNIAAARLGGIELELVEK